MLTCEIVAILRLNFLNHKIKNYSFLIYTQHVARGKRTSISKKAGPKKFVLALGISESPPANYTGEVLYKSGRREWYYKGLKHRVGDKPAEIDWSGDKKWFKKRKPYRNNDKPNVVLSNGAKFWLNKKNQIHRETGPAAIFADGSNIPSHYFLEGKELSKEEWEIKIKELRQEELAEAENQRLDTIIKGEKSLSFVPPRRRVSPLAQ